jgi:hypothetical protein
VWEIGEDSSGEFKIHLAADPQQELKFLPQPIPLHNSDLSVVDHVAPTPAALAAWLQADPDLIVRHVGQQSVGSGIQATLVDVSVRPQAQNSDPGCPAGLSPCVAFFEFMSPGAYDFNLAIANHQTVRLLLAPVSLDNKSKTMLILLDPGTPDHLDGLAEATKGMLQTLQVQPG